MKRMIMITSIAAALASTTACGQQNEPPAQGSATGFALSFFRNVNADFPKDENVVVSPYSAGVALSMLEAGAEGQTKAEFNKALDNILYKADDLRLGAVDGFIIFIFRNFLLPFINKIKNLIESNGLAPFIKINKKHTRIDIVGFFVHFEAAEVDVFKKAKHMHSARNGFACHISVIKLFKVVIYNDIRVEIKDFVNIIGQNIADKKAVIGCFAQSVKNRCACKNIFVNKNSVDSCVKIAESLIHFFKIFLCER